MAWLFFLMMTSGHAEETRTVTNYFAPFYTAGKHAYLLVDSFLPVDLRTLIPDEGLVVDVIPRRGRSIESYRAAVKNDDYRFNWLGIKFGKRQTRLNVEVASFGELKDFLLTLPDDSIKELRILSHMSSGQINEIIQYPLFEIDESLQRKFVFNARVKMMGCNYGEGIFGKIVSASVARFFLGLNGGELTASTHLTGSIGTINVVAATLHKGDVGDLISLTGLIKVVVSPGGETEVTTIRSLFSSQ